MAGVDTEACATIPIERNKNRKKTLNKTRTRLETVKSGAIVRKNITSPFHYLDLSHVSSGLVNIAGMFNSITLINYYVLNKHCIVFYCPPYD